MTYCKKCGATLQPGMKFCTKCGQPVSLQPQAPQQPHAPQPVRPQAPVMPQAHTTQSPQPSKGMFTNAVRSVANAVTGGALNRQIAEEQRQAINQQTAEGRAEIREARNA